MKRLSDVLPSARTAAPNGQTPAPSRDADCERCKGAGFLGYDVPLGHPLFGQTQACACRRLSLPVGIHPSEAGQRFRTFDAKLNPSMNEALRACQAVAAWARWGAFLIGGTGCGKTHLARAAAITAHDLGRGSAFWTVPEFLAFMRGLLQRGIEGGWGGADMEGFTEQYARTPALLVLDDLGTENKTDWTAERLYIILDRRYSRRLPTIVTTNEDVEKIDQRIRSRYREVLVICKGADLRGKVARP